MRVRFQADADLNLVILLALVRREPAIDFRTAVAAGLAGLSDLEVLAMASRDGRVLVTHDQKTMPGHFGEFIATEASAGLLVVRLGPEKNLLDGKGWPRGHFFLADC